MEVVLQDKACCSPVLTATLSPEVEPQHNARAPTATWRLEVVSLTGGCQQLTKKQVPGELLLLSHPQWTPCLIRCTLELHPEQQPSCPSIMVPHNCSCTFHRFSWQHGTVAETAKKQPPIWPWRW